MDRRFFFTLAGAGLASGLSACGRVSDPVSRLKSSFNGDIIARSDGAYNQWRTGLAWQMNAAERYPALIARPRDLVSAKSTLAFASDEGLKVVCRSGGHNVANSFLRKDSIVLDLANFSDIDLNLEDKTAWVGPAAWSWRMAQVFEPNGLSFPYAHCASVPMGGYLLGGGIGINGDHWGGMGCHAVIAVKVLLANGDMVEADAQNNADIFWAVRGSGTGFFGTVLAYKLQLFDAPQAISEQYYFYPLEAAGEVATWLTQLSQACPSDVELMMMFTSRPPPLVGPRPIDKKMCFAQLAIFAGDDNRAKIVHKILAASPAPTGRLFDVPVKPTNMNDVLIGSVDPNLGLGFGRYNVETIWTDRLATALEELIPAFIETPSPKTHVLASPRHGLQTRDNSAFSVYGQSFIGIYTVWDSPQDDDANRSWANQAASYLDRFAQGRYVNELDAFTYPKKLASCFSEGSLRQIEELRKNYDPESVFCRFPGQDQI